MLQAHCFHVLAQNCFGMVLENPLDMPNYFCFHVYTKIMFWYGMAGMVWYGLASYGWDMPNIQNSR